MYRLAKDLHLAVGLFLSAFLLLYGLSAFMMGHGFLFRWTYPKGVKQEMVVTGPTKPAEIIETIRAEHDMRGDLHQVKTSSLGLSFHVMRPGSRFDVNYETASQTATIYSKRSGFWHTIGRLHHMGGIYHDDARMNAWGWFIFAGSMLMMGVGFSGVYLWFKRHKDRRIGGMFFIGSFVFAGLLLVLVRLV